LRGFGKLEVGHHQGHVLKVGQTRKAPFEGVDEDPRLDATLLEQSTTRLMDLAS
jgi:hypothetical protein